MKRNILSLLLAILLLASFLRLYKLDQIPPGFLPDEADMGYSAYSILYTGLSQYGTFNPLAIQELSGGSHPPVYTYILMPFIHFFGLSVFIDRLPNALFGIATVLLIFYIVKNLFKKNDIALLAAFLTAVNPWAIHLSRQGLLESSAVFFVTLGVLFFLWGSKSQKYYLFSAISFGISLFSYDAPKVFLPLFVLVLVAYQFKKGQITKKSIFSFLAIFGFFYLVIIKGLLFDGNVKDFDLVKGSVEATVHTERTLTNAPRELSDLFHNKVTVSFGKFTANYSSMLRMSTLFFNGNGNYIHSVGPHGLFHAFELPFFFIGMYLVLKKRQKEGMLLLAWLVLGPLPGAITAANNPFRSSLFLPVPLIFSSFGIIWFFNYLKNFSLLKRIVAKSIVVIVAGIFITSYLFTYFFDFPVYASEWWRHEENNALVYAHSQKDNYNTIFVSDRLENNYAFANTTDPRVMQQAFTKKEQYKGFDVIRIDNIYFGHFQPEKIATFSAFFPPNSLIIVKGDYYAEEKVIKNFNKIKTGNILYKAVETEKR